MMMDLGSVNAPPPLYTGTLALIGQFRMILMCKRKKGKKLTSGKQQASSLTVTVGFDRMNLERNKYV